MTYFDPRIVWFRLTAFIRLCTIVLVLSIGAWLGGFLLGPDMVPEHVRARYYKEADEYYHSTEWEEDCETWKYADPTKLPHWRFLWCGKSDVGSLAELIERDVDEKIERDWKWETRKTVQNPSSVIFWISLLLLGLAVWVRRQPDDFDSLVLRIPIVKDYYPPILKRYKVTAVSESGEGIASELYRTLSDAKLAASKLDRPGSQVRIEGEDSASSLYKKFLREKG